MKEFKLEILSIIHDDRPVIIPESLNQTSGRPFPAAIYLTSQKRGPRLFLFYFLMKKKNSTDQQRAFQKTDILFPAFPPGVMRGPGPYFAPVIVWNFLISQY